ncbi:SemiSWEET transporter [Candidatus Saganbacteria bacterium]|nr:SemiSWEET transporter [Candidatus Saganbacteria bacterium]
MDLILIIGTLAAMLTTAAFVPQVVKAHQTKHTKDLSLLMYLLFAAGITLWIIYGFSLRSIPVIAANSVTLVLSLYLVFLKVKYG